MDGRRAALAGSEEAHARVREAVADVDRRAATLGDRKRMRPEAREEPWLVALRDDRGTARERPASRPALEAAVRSEVVAGPVAPGSKRGRRCATTAAEQACDQP